MSRGAIFGKFGAQKREAYLKLLRQGNHRFTAARGVGVSDELIRLFRKANPDFGKEEEAAEIEANGQVEDALFKAATSGNVTACQVWLYNRCPGRWADKRNVQHTGADGGPIEAEVRVMHDESWYGNNPHSQASQAIAAPAADAPLPEPVQGPGVRSALGENGHGPVNGHPRPR